jgi:hypothetical protein
MASCNEIVVHVIHTFEGKVFFSLSVYLAAEKQQMQQLEAGGFEMLDCRIDFTCLQCTQQSKFAATLLCSNVPYFSIDNARVIYTKKV